MIANGMTKKAIYSAVVSDLACRWNQRPKTNFCLDTNLSAFHVKVEK